MLLFPRELISKVGDTGDQLVQQLHFIDDETEAQNRKLTRQSNGTVRILRFGRDTHMQLLL